MAKLCACGCGQAFEPRSKNQRFFDPLHRVAYWTKKRRPAWPLWAELKDLDENQMNQVLRFVRELKGAKDDSVKKRD